MRDNILEAEYAGEEKTGIFQAKGERLGVVTIVRGLHYAAYTDAEKKTRKAGTSVQGWEMRDIDLESGHSGS